MLSFQREAVRPPLATDRRFERTRNRAHVITTGVEAASLPRRQPQESRLARRLGEDFLGYIIPRFNFVVHPVLPYIFEAQGDHYEETNCIGPDSEDHLYGAMSAITRWRPDAGM